MNNTEEIINMFNTKLNVLKHEAYQQAQSILDNTPNTVIINEEVKDVLFKILNRNITEYNDSIVKLLLINNLYIYVEIIIDLIKHFGYRINNVFKTIDILTIHCIKGLNINPIIEVKKYTLSRKEFYIWCTEYFELTPPGLMGINHWVALES